MLVTAQAPLDVGDGTLIGSHCSPLTDLSSDGVNDRAQQRYPAVRWRQRTGHGKAKVDLQLEHAQRMANAKAVYSHRSRVRWPDIERTIATAGKLGSEMDLLQSQHDSPLDSGEVYAEDLWFQDSDYEGWKREMCLEQLRELSIECEPRSPTSPVSPMTPVGSGSSHEVPESPLVGGKLVNFQPRRYVGHPHRLVVLKAEAFSAGKFSGATVRVNLQPRRQRSVSVSLV